jgi:hypothetical protein
VKNDEDKERRRSKSVRNEGDKVSASSERTERHVKPTSCTETSTPSNKVYEEYNLLSCNVMQFRERQLFWGNILSHVCWVMRQ